MVLRQADPRELRFMGYRASPNVRIPQFAQAQQTHRLED
jgi:hypothetical protein